MSKLVPRVGLPRVSDVLQVKNTSDFECLVGISEIEMLCKTMQTGWKGEMAVQTLLEQQPALLHIVMYSSGSTAQSSERVLLSLQNKAEPCKILDFAIE